MAKPRAIILFILMMFTIHLWAQEITVEEFYQSDELTALRGQTEKKDEDGNRYALIRVLTTDKGFYFDVGSVGSEPPDESKVAQIWVYVGQGARHISISHKKYGRCERFEFPTPLEGGRTYVMKLKYDRGQINTFDNSRHQKFKLKVTPANAVFRLNGVKINLNENGEPEEEQELPYVTNQYTVEAEGYYRQDSIISIDDNKEIKELEIKLVPITGFLRVDSDPYAADVFIDGELKGRANLIEPFLLPIGKYSVKVTANGYKDDTKMVEITEKSTSLLSFKLTQKALYEITSTPLGAHITVDKENLGTTPCNKELATGLHMVKVTKAGYKNFEKNMQLNSSNPNLHVSLSKIFNYKNEFYIEANGRIGTFLAFGGTIGCYLSKFNIEASYLYGTGESEPIYWNSKEFEPIACTYTPAMNMNGKIGFGIAAGTRFRITPQIGINLLKLKEKIANNSSGTPADGANIVNGVASMRFSFAVVNHLELVITPEYYFAMTKSKGFSTLSELSSKIKGWGEGFNLKIGLAIFF